MMRRVIIFTLAIVIFVLLTIVLVRSAERTTEEWFALLVTIEKDVAQADFENRKIKNFNVDDRKFVRKMLNELTVSSEAKPTPAQGQWLLAIRNWINESNGKR